MNGAPRELPPGWGSARGAGRHRSAEGIALLVVMIAFVVLYLVVYQLYFSTGMEARIAQVRYSEVESTIALQSAALYVLTLLIEDLRSSMSQAASGGSSLGGSGIPTVGATGGGAAGGAASPVSAAVPMQASTGSTGTGKWYNYLHQNVFSRGNRQQVGNTEVKLHVEDGESKFDLNRLFDYVRLPGEEVTEGVEDARTETNASADASDETEVKRIKDGLQLRTNRQKDKSGQGTGTGKKTTSDRKSGSGQSGDTSSADASAEAGETSTVDEALGEYDPEEEWELPSEERIQATRAMVERAVMMVFSINEEAYGRYYSERNNYTDIANAIVDYVLERRRSAYQNRIYLVTELLNIPLVTREVFYGPVPDLKEGEEMRAPMDPNFTYVRDEFGDIVVRCDLGFQDPYEEEQKKMLEDLQRQFGRFMDYPGMGRLGSNALTRGMSEPCTDFDQNGYEYRPEEPWPIGLKDIFTTFSTGRININTAPVPVLSALLMSCSDVEAKEVAFAIRDYRNRMQEEEDEASVEGVDRVVDSKTKDLGQPKTRKKDETEAGATAADASSLYPDYSSLDPTGAASLSATYEDLPTNYFTSLDQLDLVDGTDGGPTDLLRKDEGVDRVSSEQDTLFRRVHDDLAKVVVFGSTYFQAELKARGKNSLPGKTGFLTVKRDPKKKRIEVVMWKTQQK